MRWYGNSGDPRFSLTSVLMTLTSNSNRVVPLPRTLVGTFEQTPTFTDANTPPVINRGPGSMMLGITQQYNDANHSKFWRSLDNGKTWQPYKDTATPDPFVAKTGKPADTGFILVGQPIYRSGAWFCGFRSTTNVYGVFRSTNAGQDWTYYSDGRQVTYGSEYPYISNGFFYDSKDHKGIQGFTNAGIIVNDNYTTDGGLSNLALNTPMSVSDAYTDSRFVQANAGQMCGYNNYLLQNQWTSWDVVTPPRSGQGGNSDHHQWTGTALQYNNLNVTNRWMTANLPNQGSYITDPNDTSTTNYVHNVFPVTMPIKVLCSYDNGTVVVACSDIVSANFNQYRGWSIQRYTPGNDTWTTVFSQRGTQISFGSTYPSVVYQPAERRAMWRDGQNQHAYLGDGIFVFSINIAALGGIGYLLSSDDGQTWTYTKGTVDNLGELWCRR